MTLDAFRVFAMQQMAFQIAFETHQLHLVRHGVVPCSSSLPEPEIHQATFLKSYQLVKERQYDAAKTTLWQGAAQLLLYIRDNQASIERAWIFWPHKSEYRLVRIVSISWDAQNCLLTVTWIRPEGWTLVKDMLNLSYYLHASSVGTTDTFPIVPYMNGVPENEQKAIMLALNARPVRFVTFN